MEAGWSARQVARQVDHSDLTYTRSPLILIHRTLASQRYVHNILQPPVLPLTAGLLEAIFNKKVLDNTQQGCHKTASILSWPARSLDLSPIEHNWNHLARQVGQPPNLVELKVSFTETV
ncbi:transposable element Tcb2 transposase [Trichonephila clavipes]|nr:transposable element Tcb2 transposase [Trichonephila clavipes]